MNHQYLLIQSFPPEKYILEGAAPGFVSLGKCNLVLKVGKCFLTKSLCYLCFWFAVPLAKTPHLKKKKLSVISIKG